MEDYLKFRKMITPIIIQLVFWLLVAAVLISAIYIMVTGGLAGVFVGLFWFVFGVITVRVYCEMLILLFKMHECLEAIRDAQAPGPSQQP
jgi:putative exporter of polyketide antibiotics